MGAFSEVFQLDTDRLAAEVAPSLLRWVRGDLGVSVFGGCELVRGDLGVNDDDVLLLATEPRQKGTCHSTTCSDRDKCPLQQPEHAEDFMWRLRMTIQKGCLSEPTVIGRPGIWYVVARWVGLERGVESGDRDAYVLEQLNASPELPLLLRLFKRGAAIGWGDGGEFEGLLGWLDVDETQRLAASLAALDLADDAPIPTTIVENAPYDASHTLPRMREMMRTLRDVAVRAVAKRRGIAIVRS